MPALISENRFPDTEFPIFNTPAIIIDTNAGLNGRNAGRSQSNSNISKIAEFLEIKFSGFVSQVVGFQTSLFLNPKLWASHKAFSVPEIATLRTPLQTQKPPVP